MSNCSHYYGDIPAKRVFYQNQILDHWCTLPFQLFCFNFGTSCWLLGFIKRYIGATHIIHHYIPGQPFYLRQMIYPAVKPGMVALGVRNNDLGIAVRANRYFSDATVSSRGGWWFYTCMLFGSVFYAIHDVEVMIALGRRLVKRYILGVKDAEVTKLFVPPSATEMRNLADTLNE